MDDKWLFHTSYLRQVASNIGLKLEIVAPIYESINDVFSRAVRISLYGAGLGEVPVSEKFWEILNQFDLGIPPNLKSRLVPEGIIILGKS